LVGDRRSPQHVLIAGVSTRAAAESAALAGFAATTIDAFADLDQHPSVQAQAVPGGYSPTSAARAARDIECDAVVYISGFENHPRAVTTLAGKRALWGNSSQRLRRVRDPIAVNQAFSKHGHPVPALRTTEHRDTCGAVDGRAADGPDSGHWLVKPLAAGGGHGVRPWNGRHVPGSCYMQEKIDGVSGSVVFVAARGRAVPLGVFRQLIGEEAFGASGYQYCGNILAAREDPELIDAASGLARTAASEFGLVGVNGIDFVARGGVPYPVEVNPRWCASAELIERSFEISVFAMHAAACAAGDLSEFDVHDATRGRGAVGKAVVFARFEVILGDTRRWLEDGPRASIRDVPHPGEVIRAGRPVCTVFAAAPDRETCHAELVRSAEFVYAEIAAWQRVPRPVRA
jgi:predicted ATP-grasp superfamily ATP-dependent carboligase